MAQGKLLTDLRTAGEAGDVHRTVDLDSTEDCHGIVGHRGGVERFGLGRQWRSARPGVVEGDEAVAVGQAVELELPRLHGIGETAEEQHVRSGTTRLDPEGSVSTRVDAAAERFRRRPGRHAGSVNRCAMHVGHNATRYTGVIRLLPDPAVPKPGEELAIRQPLTLGR